MKTLTPMSSCLALFGALAAAGYGGTAFAVPFVADTCGAQSGSQTSQVLDAVQNNGGSFAYGFRVCNTSANNAGPGERNELIIDWELPWFGTGSGQTIGVNDSGITGINAPPGWTWSIEAIGTENDATGWGGNADWQFAGDAGNPPNEMYTFFNNFFGGEANNPYNDVTHVLHFYENCEFDGEFQGECAGPIFPGDSLWGFGFDSPYGSTNAPYQASWELQPVRTGDPQFPLGGQPNNPTIQQALANRPIPEPGTLAMLGLGLGALAASRRRRPPTAD